jgi:putative ABC transport system permease protein
MKFFLITLRLMARYRWFTLAGILGLSLGIACSILIFLYAYGHLSTDRHHPFSDRIYRVVLQIETPSGGIEYEPGTSLPMHKALFLSMLAGYYPAVRLSGFDPVRAITGQMASPEKKQTGRKMLLALQYAVAIFFLSSTMVMVGQVDFMLESETGFNRENVVNIRVPRGDAERLATFRNEVVKLSGVTAASLHNEPPMTPTNDGGFIRIVGHQDSEDFIVRERWGDEHFLETYAIPLVAGRNLIIRDDTLAELLVNEAFVERLQVADPNDILGTRILIDNSGTHGEIVGVVRNFHNQSLQREIEPLVINPLQALFNRIGIRIEGQSVDRTLSDVRTLFEQSFPDALFEYAFLDDSIRRMYRTEEATGRLMRIFTVVAIVISLVGILGLSAYTNVRRSREMAIRKVLGASVPDIVGLLCRRDLMLFVAGFSLAVPAAWMLTRQWLDNFAYRIDLDWPLLALPGLLLSAATLLLLAMQSLKTARANPARSINRE